MIYLSGMISPSSLSLGIAVEVSSLRRDAEFRNLPRPLVRRAVDLGGVWVDGSGDWLDGGVHIGEIIFSDSKVWYISSRVMEVALDMSSQSCDQLL
jgi:hypothetical protein